MWWYILSKETELVHHRLKKHLQDGLVETDSAIKKKRGIKMVHYCDEQALRDDLPS